MTVFQDGINADRAARDYKKTSAKIPADGIVKSILLLAGVGWRRHKNIHAIAAAYSEKEVFGL